MQRLRDIWGRVIQNDTTRFSDAFDAKTLVARLLLNEVGETIRFHAKIDKTGTGNLRRFEKVGVVKLGYDVRRHFTRRLSKLFT